MKNKSGYQITEKDIETALKYLRLNEDENATREDAIQYLEEHKSLAHLAAHKIVEDEKTGKTEAIDLEELEKKD
jgi:hypothetical protein